MRVCYAGGEELLDHCKKKLVSAIRARPQDGLFSLEEVECIVLQLGAGGAGCTTIFHENYGSEVGPGVDGYKKKGTQ